MNVINERLAVIDYLENGELSFSCLKLFYFDKNMAFLDDMTIHNIPETVKQASLSSAQFAQFIHVLMWSGVIDTE